MGGDFLTDDGSTIPKSSKSHSPIRTRIKFEEFTIEPSTGLRGLNSSKTGQTCSTSSGRPRKSSTSAANKRPFFSPFYWAVGRLEEINRFVLWHQEASGEIIL